MENWMDNLTNKENVQSLRSLLAEGDIPVFIFLGAGLSFAVGRDRILFELFEHDDDARFPSWPQLMHRMNQHLLSDPYAPTFRGLC